MKTFKFALLLPIALCVSDLVRANTIALWTFETSQPTTQGPFSPEVGSGTATSAIGGTVSNPAGNGSTESWSSSGWDVDDYFQFRVSTLGYHNIMLAWDQVSSATGPGTFGLFWSLTGVAGSFTQVGANYSVPQPTSGPWGSYTADLSSISGLNNASAAFFRLVDMSTLRADGNAGGVQTGGTDRVDNFTVMGSPITRSVPDTLPPSFGIFAILGMLAFAKLERARMEKSWRSCRIKIRS